MECFFRQLMLQIYFQRFFFYLKKRERRFFMRHIQIINNKISFLTLWNMFFHIRMPLNCVETTSKCWIAERIKTIMRSFGIIFSYGLNCSILSRDWQNYLLWDLFSTVFVSSVQLINTFFSMSLWFSMPRNTWWARKRFIARKIKI